MDTGSRKEIIPKDILIDVLNKMDYYYKEHINNNPNSKFYHFLVARLYIELSLLLPLKPCDMAKLQIGNIKDEHFCSIEN